MLGDDGVTARLGYIKLFQAEIIDPAVIPYPDLSWFKKNDCNGITSAYRMTVSSSLENSQFDS